MSHYDRVSPVVPLLHYACCISCHVVMFPRPVLVSRPLPPPSTPTVGNVNSSHAEVSNISYTYCCNISSYPQQQQQHQQQQQQQQQHQQQHRHRIHRYWEQHRQHMQRVVRWGWKVSIVYHSCSSCCSDSSQQHPQMPAPHRHPHPHPQVHHQLQEHASASMMMEMIMLMMR